MPDPKAVETVARLHHEATTWPEGSMPWADLSEDDKRSRCYDAEPYLEAVLTHLQTDPDTREKAARAIYDEHWNLKYDWHTDATDVVRDHFLGQVDAALKALGGDDA